MHIPETNGERVRVFNPETNEYDIGGEYTGEAGQYGEHFVIACDDGMNRRLHYEDIKASKP